MQDLLNKREKGPLLSPRQMNVLTGLAEGLSNKQIAKQLGISEPTVKMHMSALLKLFEAKNRVQVLLKAKQFKII